jgi:hypothetical protein
MDPVTSPLIHKDSGRQARVDPGEEDPSHPSRKLTSLSAEGIASLTHVGDNALGDGERLAPPSTARVSQTVLMLTGSDRESVELVVKERRVSTRRLAQRR